MKKYLFSLCATAFLAVSCRETAVKVPDCQSVTAIISDSSCISAQQGLLLTASGYKLPERGQFEWHIYAFKDIASINLIAKNQWSNFTEEDKFLVPASVTNDNSVLVVAVKTLCNGRKFDSLNFRLVKEKTSNPNCSVWKNQPF